ncbi:hypothetical protein SUGI_0506720 [Cryptomeria japonica]|uniref:large ribosomal subunit protein bL19c n=1 Tax=Cryptomeria japonica TaxID=3369 RepID=UPI00240899CC|nr:large ribosomal subunit protein bL19c [Cryptomeria japonica]GLJ26328.1 hypothetical protein SUGI_0506720 [Cryptomeria japonica]
MAANILHQVPGFALTRVVIQPSKPKLALPISFASAMNPKGQPLQLCAPLTATLVTGSRCTSLSSSTKKRNLIAHAESDSTVSEPEKDDTQIDAASSDDTQIEAASPDGTTLVTTEEQLQSPPTKPRVKLGDIMGMLNKQAVEAAEEARPTPDVRPGDIIELRVASKTRRRLYLYKGIVISRQNAGIHTTIRVRRIIAGIGIEIVFPLYSPKIKEIKVVKHRKVRRAKLYYLRDKLPRFSTFK